MRLNRCLRLSVLVLVFCHVVGIPVSRAEQKIEGDEPPHAGIALVPLLEDLASGTLYERIAAAMTIRELGATARLSVPLLIEALNGDSVALRRSSAGALGGIGPAA